MASKNTKNSTGQKKQSKERFAISTDCENCKIQCTKGKAYLKRFKQKLEGKGVYCEKL